MAPSRLHQDPRHRPIVPLSVIVVGAGIGGLTAATALRRAGHNVKLFEQSRFKEEVGAAIHVCANASRCLVRLGMKPEDLHGVPCLGSLVYKGDGTPIREHWNDGVEEKYGSPWWLVHRVDLHSSLRQLAVGPDGEGTPAELHLASPVVAVDTEAGSVTLESGEIHKADLVVAADGVHSTIRETAFDSKKAVTTGSRAFRFVLDAKDTDNVPDVIQPTYGCCHAFIERDRRFVLYPCRDGTLYNCVLIVQDGVPGKVPTTGWRSAATVEDMLAEFKAPQFSDLVINAIKRAESVKCWQLLKREPIDKWVKDRVCLLGDAAHPMLPYQGQGGGQAIEDGAVLGQLFPLGTAPEHVPRVLELYNQARYHRASVIQRISSSEETMNPVIESIDVDPFIMGHDAIEFAKQLRTTDLPEIGDYQEVYHK